MSSPNNNIKKSIAPKSLFDDMSSLVDATISFNKGDLLYLDTATHLIKPVGADANSQTLLGAARETVVLGKLKDPYLGTDTDASAKSPNIAGPVYGVEAEYILKTADAINPGDLVYVQADPQTVTVTDSGATSDPVGIYNGDAIASAAAGQKIVILLGCNYPGRVLKF